MSWFAGHAVEFRKFHVEPLNVATHLLTTPACFVAAEALALRALAPATALPLVGAALAAYAGALELCPFDVFVQAGMARVPPGSTFEAQCASQGSEGGGVAR